MFTGQQNNARSQAIDELDMTGEFAPPDLYEPVQGDIYARMQQDTQDFLAGRNRALAVAEMPRLTGWSQILKPGTLAIIAGNEGGGKTFFAIDCLFASYAKTKTGFYMPLEGRVEDIFERIAMRVQQDWSASIHLDGRETEAQIQAMGKDRAFILEKSERAINTFKNHISAPPGMTNAHATQWNIVADEAVKKMHKNRVVIIDNLSFVGFDQQSKIHDQGVFAQTLLAGAQGTGCTCILINHTNKIGRKERGGVMTTDDIAGSALVQRMADCVIIISSHDDKESEVFCDDGTKLVSHNKTIAIAKSRHGKGAHKTIAYHFGQKGPTWEELGVINHA